MMLRRFLMLPQSDRGLVLRALAVQTIIIVGLRVLRFNRVDRFVRRIGRPSGNDLAGCGTTPERVVWSVAASGRVLGRLSTCLSAALTGAALLRRSGCSAVVAIGIRPHAEAGLRAHAWVENHSKIVIGNGDENDFDVLVRLDGLESASVALPIPIFP